MTHSCNPNTQEPETGGKPGLRREFKTRQGYIAKPCLREGVEEEERRKENRERKESRGVWERTHMTVFFLNLVFMNFLPH